MSLRPLPDFDNAELLAKLGREHALRNAWLDAVKQLRDSVQGIQSAHEGVIDDGIVNADEAIKRLILIRTIK